MKKIYRHGSLIRALVCCCFFSGGFVLLDAVCQAQAGDEASRSIVYAFRDPKTGMCSLNANGYLLSKLDEPRKVTFVSLWKFNPDLMRWQHVDFTVKDSVVIKPVKREIYSHATDPLLVQLTKEVGLFWAEWTENGISANTLVFSGAILCNDIMIGNPPEDMIATCVPFKDSAKAMFVPDPKIHCRK
jgi:hypothetical protein